MLSDERGLGLQDGALTRLLHLVALRWSVSRCGTDLADDVQAAVAHLRSERRPPMSEERVQAIRARLEKITPGPWQNGVRPVGSALGTDAHMGRVVALRDRAAGQVGLVVAMTWHPDHVVSYVGIPREQTVANAEFIAQAPQDVADLLTEREALQEQVVLLTQRVLEGMEKAPGKFLNAAGMMQFARAEQAEAALTALRGKLAELVRLWRLRGQSALEHGDEALYKECADDLAALLRDPALPVSTKPEVAPSRIPEVSPALPEDGSR